MSTSEWIQAASEAAERVAAKMPKFTSEDVWDELKAVGVQLPTGTTPRLMSLAMRRLLKDKKAQKADTKPVPHRDSRGVGRRGHPIAVWESLSLEIGQ